MKTADTRDAFVFVSPAALFALAIVAVPLAYILYMSMGGSHPSLDTYAELIASPLFRRSLFNTLDVAIWASGISLVLGYVIALHLSRQPPRQRAALMVLVLLPFWTSVLVKCYAFTVILGRVGIINQVLSWVTGSTVQLPLVLNRVGVLVGMTNYLTPFIVFPVLASLLAIEPSLYRAASIMGARPARVFWTVTLPLSLPGVLAGVSSVLVMSLGFFIVPALLGGPRDAMLSNLVDFYTRETLDWNAASAIGVILLGLVVIISAFVAACRRIRLGGVPG